MVDGGMIPDELAKAIERLDAAPESCAAARASWKLKAGPRRSGQWTSLMWSRSGVTAARAIRGPQFGSERNPVPSTPTMAPRGAQIFCWRQASPGSHFRSGWPSHGVRMRGNPVEKTPTVLAEALKTPGPQANEAAGAMNRSRRCSPARLPVCPPIAFQLARSRSLADRYRGSETARCRFRRSGNHSALASGTAPAGLEHDRAVWQRQGYELEQPRRLLSFPWPTAAGRPYE